MPVEDHPVHEHGVRSADHHPACYNRKPLRPDGYMVPAGYDSHGHLKFLWVPYSMSTKCRQVDDLPECRGCSAEKDHEYITKMKGLR